MAAHGGDPLKVIRAAFYANLGIAVCKLVAAYLSKSAATLAEAVHSIADTGNQGLLFTGVILASKQDGRHAFGRAAERYFWPFVVAVLLFSVGGAFAVYEGIHKMVVPEAPDLSDFWSFRHGPLTSLVVLGVSALMEGYSCSVALREFRRDAGDRPIWRAVFDVRDPTIPLVLLEDLSALAGLTIALSAVALSSLTGSGLWDAAGSVLIGLLLMVVAVLIARDTHSLLLGERATPEMEQAAQRLTEGSPGVVAVTQLLSMHLGPDDVVLAMKVAFPPDMRVDRVEEVIDEIERRIRSELPLMKRIFIEPDSRGDGRGVSPDHAPRSEPRAAKPGAASG
jgi:cation diffusion facilitator family transporter